MTNSDLDTVEVMLDSQHSATRRLMVEQSMAAMLVVFSTMTPLERVSMVQRLNETIELAYCVHCGRVRDRRRCICQMNRKE